MGDDKKDEKKDEKKDAEAATVPVAKKAGKRRLDVGEQKTQADAPVQKIAKADSQGQSASRPFRTSKGDGGDKLEAKTSTKEEEPSDKASPDVPAAVKPLSNADFRALLSRT